MKSVKINKEYLDALLDIRKMYRELKKENKKIKEVIADIEFIVKPEREKFLISKWGKIYGKIQALRILHNIDIKELEK